MTSYTFDQLIDFTRSSSGTYTNSAGVITLTAASVNLLLYTENFDKTNWVSSGGGIAVTNPNSIAAPDGTMTADTLTASGANGVLRETVSIAAGATGTHTFSIYLLRKTGTGNIDISVDGTTYVTQTINNTTWTRVQTQLSLTSGSKFPGIRIATSGDEVYAWGAQLELASTASTYTKNYGSVYPARFDYDPVTLLPLGYLNEGASTNLLLNSLIDGTNLSTQTVTTSALSYTLSFYGTGTVTLSGTGTAVVVGSGVYPTRTLYTFIATAGSLLLTVTGTVQYAQLESRAYVSTFMPTGASTATRQGDTSLIQSTRFSPWYNQAAGTFVVVYDTSKPRADGSSWYSIAATDNSTNNVVSLRNQSSNAVGQVTAGGVTSASLSSAVPNPLLSTTLLKLALAYSQDSFAQCLNGGTVVTDNSGSVPSTISQLGIGNLNGSSQLPSHIKSIVYYPLRMSDAQLQALTI
jgi:hypothetical protein